MNYFDLLNSLGAIDDEEETEEEYELTTMILCGCKQHFIDSRKDPYKEHNEWVEGSLKGVEDGQSHLKHIRKKR
tara:strand:- start:468 stop:689 length:222 start_codon:yes stop_codon:yes gene_type:complete